MLHHIDLPGYTIGTVQSRHRDRVIYKAQREHDAKSVIIETLDTDYPGRRQLAEIKREAALYDNLSTIKGVISLHEVISYGSGNLALVLERFDSTLRELMLEQDGEPLEATSVIGIALQITKTLEQVHKAGLVHKAIAAENVMVNPHTLDIALSGFGIASELEQEPQATHISRKPQGYLAYMSPEQTGRMNRDLDYRSDYYSLGVLLYELLTAERPFKAQSLLEWVHCHISQQAIEPHKKEPTVPYALSIIVSKLLQKNPDDRYNSASGLLHDLVQCEGLLLSNSGNISNDNAKALGSKDIRQKFLIPQGLYGREEELARLLEYYEDAVDGITQFCLVHGYSGVGKTALVNELDKYQIKERGFVVQAKFDQYHQGDTYSTLISAFRGLIQQILLEPKDNLLVWQQKLLEALDNNGGVVIEFLPELEIIIGEQPEVVELLPTETQNRLHRVLTSFLHVFADAGHPVVLFLDDLQWCDVPTLHLLQHIITSKEQSHLLIIGAYRSNEVPNGHPLQIMLDEVSQSYNINQIAVKPLDKISVGQMVADCLDSSVESTLQLSELLFQKAKGNPFFTTELLRHLHKVGAISRDNTSQKWVWDQSLADWRDVSSDVVEFMVSSLRTLSKDTQDLLQLAACIGNRFDLQTLSRIYNRPVKNTAKALLDTIQQYTIRPLHNDYRLVDSVNDTMDLTAEFSFQHDRVQQAAYNLIDENKRAQMHLKIGRLMWQQHDYDVPAEYIIDVAEHLNIAVDLINDTEERIKLALLNLHAARRARSSSAYEVAYKHILIAQKLAKLVGDVFAQHEKALAEESQLCTYLTGRIEEAEIWMEKRLKLASSALEKSEILATRTRQYATLNRMADSVQSAVEGLALLGIHLPSNPSEQDVKREQERVLESLNGRAIESLIESPPEQDEKTLVAMKLFMEVFAAAFLSGTGQFFPFLVLKSVNLSLKSGLCPESAFAYASYGMILCGELDDPALGYQYGKLGLAINEKLGDLKLRSRVIYLYAMFVHHWSEHWTSLTPWFKKGIEAGYQTGDLLYLAYSAQDCVIWDPKLDLETAHRLHTENLDIVRECAYQDSLDSGTLFLQLQRALLGLTENETSFNDHEFDEQTCLEGMQQRQFKTGVANYHIYKAELCFIHGDVNQARLHLEQQDKLIRSAMSLPQLVRYYLVANLTLAEHYPFMSGFEQAETLERLNKDLARMKRWSQNCEANFLHLYYLMRAELENLSGNITQALELYDLSIEHAQKHQFMRDEALASERAARMLLANGKRRSSEGYLRGAYKMYDAWGAEVKVKRLKGEFPFIKEVVTSFSSNEEWDFTLDIDSMSVLKASREISSEIVLERLLDKVMHILLENAGAQWGCLVLSGKSETSSHLLVENAILPKEGLDPLCVPEHSALKCRNDMKIPLPVTLLTHVLRMNNPLVLHNAATEGEFKDDPYILKFKPKSIICVPIKRKQFEAAIYMENNLSEDVFSKTQIEVVSLLVAQASVAVENARLYEQVQEYSKTLEDKVTERTTQLEKLNKELRRLAHRDGLTGVANRRRADNYLSQTWSVLWRAKQPLSVIMLDVDHFKAYNDNYGHQAGDHCLVKISHAIQNVLSRQGDMIARYGGEEFIVILPNTSLDGAFIIGEKMRLAVESLQLEHAHSSVANVVSISIGAATAMPSSETNKEMLVKQADSALYEAKKQGRNMVSLFSPY